MGRAGVVLGWAVSHTKSSHQGLMIREGGATVRVMACRSFESLTGDTEPRNCLGKIRAEEKLIPENQLLAIPFSNHQ